MITLHLAGSEGNPNPPNILLDVRPYHEQSPEDEARDIHQALLHLDSRTVCELRNLLNQSITPST